MITARELVFYIRAEDQASRVVKRAAKSFGSLSNIKNLQNEGVKQQLQYTKQIDQAQQSVRKNLTQIDRAQVAASRSARALSVAQTRYGSSHPITQEKFILNQAALENLATYNKELELAQANVTDLERRQKAASAANAQLVSEAQLARTRNWIQSIQGVARAFRLVGVAAGAALAFAAHSAANFQTQLTLAASQARPIGAGPSATTAIAGRLQNVVLQQMQKFPATSQQMASALYDIFSSTNIQGIKQAGGFLTTLNKAAVAGGVDLGTMSNAAITLFNNFVVGGKKGGDEFNNLTQALNVFFSAVRFGRMNATQFANSLSFVSGIAKEAGLSFKDIADAMAILTRQTGANRTGQDAQGLARLIQQLSTGADITGLKKIGVDPLIAGTKNLKPLLPLLDDIKKHANLAGVNALNFFKVIGNTKGTIQAQRAFAYLTGNMDQYKKVSKDVNSDTTEFQKSFVALSKSPGVQWQVFINQLKALSIIIGTQAIPAFVSLGKYVAEALKWFNGLSDQTKHDIGYWGVYASVIAAVGGTLVIVAGSVGKLILTFKELRLASLAGEAGSATTMFGLFGLAIAAVGFLLIKYPHQVQGVINSLGGLHTILKALSIVILALSFNSVIRSLTTLSSESVAAQASVDGLRLGLLKLTLIGAITVPILMKYSSEFDKDPRNKKGLGNFINKTIGKVPYLGTAAKGSFEAGLKIDDALGLSEKAHKEAIAKAQRQANIAFSTSFGRTKELQAILTNPKESASIKSFAQQQYTSGNFTGLNKIYAQMVTPAIKAAAKIAAANKKIAKSASDAAKDSAWNKLFQRIITLDKFSKAHPLDMTAIKTLLNAEQKLQKASTGNQYAAATQYLSALESTWTKADNTVAKHVKNMAKLMKQNIANAKSTISTLTSSIQSMYDTINQQNQTLYGTLFQGPVVSGARVQDNLQFGGHVTGLDLLKDLKAQNFQFNRVNNQLGSLAKRGAPKALIDQIRALGPDAIPDIKQLMGLTPTQFKQYISAFNKGQADIKKNTIQQLNQQLKIYESYGKKIAMAIINGVQSQDQAVQKVLKNTILEMFPGLAHQAKLSPKITTPNRITLPSSIGGTYHTHYHITAAGDKINDTVTAIKHVDFVKRNKHKGNS